jgi:hypothetical protein
MEISISMGAYSHTRDAHKTFNAQVSLSNVDGDPSISINMDEIKFTIDMDAAELMDAVRTLVLKEKGLL